MPLIFAALRLKLYLHFPPSRRFIVKNANYTPMLFTFIARDKHQQHMKKTLHAALSALLLAAALISTAQCTIDTANTRTGFSPNNPAPIRQGVSYAQTVQVYIPTTYSGLTLDSLHIDSITGMPNGITYILNPVAGTVPGGGRGAFCFSGTTTDTLGPYPLTFYGFVYTPAMAIPFSALAGQFSYTLRIEANPIAAFMVDSPACSITDSVTFTDLSYGYPTRFTWTFTGGTPATSTRQFPKVYYATPGTYDVKLVAKNGLASDSITKTITVYPGISATIATTPATGATSPTGGATITPAGGTPPFTFNWSTGSATDSIANAAPGYYRILVSDTKGCRFLADAVSITFTNNILQLSAGNQLSIYPNPTGNTLTLRFTQTPDAEVTVIDLTGNQLITQTVGSTTTTFNINTLAAGTYILRITDKTNHIQQTTLFTKQ